MGAFVYESAERMNGIEHTQTANTKLFEEFNGNLNTQLTKMVEEFQKSSQQYSEVLKQISTL
jgi:hypothetical protein